MPHAHWFHPDLMARRSLGRGTHGYRAWGLLPWLLLAAVSRTLSSRDHECRRNGRGHTADFCGKDPPGGRPDSQGVGGSSAALWRGGAGLSTGAADLPGDRCNDDELSDG